MNRRFCLVLVKPSHYDDDGYVIQWLRSAIPSNSLAALYGLARDCAERRVLGRDVDIELHALDETNTRIRPARLAALIEAAGRGMVMLVGVQSNQFPRALDIARPLRERGIPVALGGFHVSGTTSMLHGDDADLARARALGLSLFAGEAEGRHRLRGHPSARGRLLAAPVSPRPATRAAGRARLAVLSRLCRRDGRQAHPMDRALPSAASHLRSHPARSPRG